MSDTVIKVENLGKLYKLGEIGTGTLSHDLNRWWAGMRGKEDPFVKIGQINDRTVKGKSDYVWALKDINFQVKQGEVLGIIGRNGAGKSTLLKILSKVATPTRGTIKVKGRIASLLEVGTGFHPELTGRENIFLNAAILGMTRSEVRAKFDEIVDFAGVERYIDTPVKRYSSGMYVRLAFSVAAFLDPEILIVDEVLAVGDAEFQKKCLSRMKDVSTNDGRTVLFVSHNLDAISNLCTACLYLNNGGLFMHSRTSDVIKQYLQVSNDVKKRYIGDSNKPIRILEAAILQDNFELYQIRNKPFQINLSLISTVETPFVLEFVIKNASGMILFFAPSGLSQSISFVTKGGQKLNIEFEFILPHLAKGDYLIDIIIAYSGVEVIDRLDNVLSLSVVDSYVKKSGFVFLDSHSRGNILLKENEFKLKKVTGEPIS